MHFQDFSIPGFRIGVIHSSNPWILSCLRTLSHYHSSPPLTQHAAASLLNDVGKIIIIILQLHLTLLLLSCSDKSTATNVSRKDPEVKDPTKE